MKLRIIVLTFCAVAGAGASFALAADGKGHRDGVPCQRAVVFGSASAPQSFTVTVTKRWFQSQVKPGQTLKVDVGSAGQTVRLAGVGCLGSDGTLTVREAELHVLPQRGGGAGGTTSTPAPTTTNP